MQARRAPASGVDLRNPNQAVDLYESLGFRIVSESFEYALGPFEPSGAAPDRPTGVAS